MKKLFFLFILSAALFTSCNASSKPTEANIPTPEPTIDTVEEIPSEPTPEPVYVSPLATEDFLLPLDKYSWEREYEPEYVMIHFTSAVMVDRDAPYNIDSIRKIFEDYEISINYIIERDGNIRCYIPEYRAAWHAGKGSYNGIEKLTDAMNRYSIGIELVAIGSQADMSVYMGKDEYLTLDESLIGFTDEQYEALKALVVDICERNNIPFDREHVIGHNEYKPEKTDPGELFDYERIMKKS